MPEKVPPAFIKIEESVPKFIVDDHEINLVTDPPKETAPPVVSPGPGFHNPFFQAYFKTNK